MLSKRVLQSVIRPLRKIENPRYVYRIIIDNGSHYVGQTKDIERRLSEHEKGAKRYGTEVVSKQVLDICDESVIYHIERSWIEYYAQFPKNTNVACVN